MINRTVRIGAAVAALAAALLTSQGVASAAPYDLPAVPVQAPLGTLQEFKTAGEAGWFYTLNANEAADAGSKHKFTKSADLGKMFTLPQPGAVAVHRLRMKSGGPSYMLSTSPTEFRDARFTDEGVIGYVGALPTPGDQLLLRFSNNGKWRVLADNPANVNNMRAAGYAVDGPFGWVKP